MNSPFIAKNLSSIDPIQPVSMQSSLSILSDSTHAHMHVIDEVVQIPANFKTRLVTSRKYIEILLKDSNIGKGIQMLTIQAYKEYVEDILSLESQSLKNNTPELCKHLFLRLSEHVQSIIDTCEFSNFPEHVCKKELFEQTYQTIQSNLKRLSNPDNPAPAA